MRNHTIFPFLIFVYLLSCHQVAAQKKNFLKFFHPYKELYFAERLTDSTFLIDGVRSSETFTAIVNGKGHVLWENQIDHIFTWKVNLIDGGFLTFSQDGRMLRFDEQWGFIESQNRFFRHRGIPALVYSVEATEDFIVVVIVADRGPYWPFGMYILDRKDGSVLDKFHSKEELEGYFPLVIQNEDDLIVHVSNEETSECYVYEQGTSLDTFSLPLWMRYPDEACIWNDHIYWSFDGGTGKLVKTDLSGQVIDQYEMEGQTYEGVKFYTLLPNKDNLFIIGGDYIEGGRHGNIELFVVKWSKQDQPVWRYQDTSKLFIGVKKIANAFLGANNNLKIFGTEGLFFSGTQGAFLYDLSLDAVTGILEEPDRAWYVGPTVIRRGSNLSDYFDGDVQFDLAIFNSEGRNCGMYHAGENWVLDLPLGWYIMRPFERNKSPVEFLIVE